jgi:hypothetical protein
MTSCKNFSVLYTILFSLYIFPDLAIFNNSHPFKTCILTLPFMICGLVDLIRNSEEKEKEKIKNTEKMKKEEVKRLFAEMEQKLNITKTQLRHMMNNYEKNHYIIKNNYLKDYKLKRKQIDQRIENYFK